MSDAKDPDTNQTEPDQPEVPEVFDMDDDVDAVGLPDHDFLGLSPGDANKERGPGDPPFPDQAY